MDQKRPERSRRSRERERRRSRDRGRGAFSRVGLLPRRLRP